MRSVRGIVLAQLAVSSADSFRLHGTPSKRGGGSSSHCNDQLAIKKSSILPSSTLPIPNLRTACLYGIQPVSFLASFVDNPGLAQLQSHLTPITRTMSSSIPKTMKGVIIEKTGGVEVLEYKTDLPVPTPKEGEVLIKNDYIGINFIDTYVFLCGSSVLNPRS